jgi:hypothetical protein
MVQKDQNRNEWKMPLELFGYFWGAIGKGAIRHHNRIAQKKKE